MYVDSNAKIFLILYPQIENSTTCIAILGRKLSLFFFWINPFRINFFFFFWRAGLKKFPPACLFEHVNKYVHLQVSSTLWWLPHLNFWLTLKAWHVPTCSFRQNSFRKTSLSVFSWQQILPKFVLYGYFSGQNAKIEIKRFAKKELVTYLLTY